MDKVWEMPKTEDSEMLLKCLHFVWKKTGIGISKRVWLAWRIETVLYTSETQVIRQLYGYMTITPIRMEMFEPYVTGLMWFNKLPDTKAVADAFEPWDEALGGMLHTASSLKYKSCWLKAKAVGKIAVQNE